MTIFVMKGGKDESSFDIYLSHKEDFMTVLVSLLVERSNKGDQ